MSIRIPVRSTTLCRCGLRAWVAWSVNRPICGMWRGHSWQSWRSAVRRLCAAEMEVECTDVVDGPDGILMVSQRVGARAPLHATGAGKLLLLNYSNQKLNEYIAVKGLRALTPHTLVTREALVNSLEMIRSRGYALEDEERELGARCVAAPVRDYSGRIVGGISVSGPTTRMSRARLEALAPLVMDMAAELSRRLAYEEWPEEGD